MATDLALSPAKRKSKRRRKMSDKELISLLYDREYKADQANTDNDYEKGIDYYLGHKLGNEVDGRSQVVVREVFSVIEWIMPSLMRMFFGTDSPVLFAPRNKGDVQQAEQETDYVNYVVSEKNDGFETFMAWFKDALMVRNAYVVAYWDECEDASESTYEGLTEDQAMLMLMDESLEMIAATVDSPDGEYPGEEATYSLTVRERYSESYARIQTIPAERVKVQANLSTVSLKKANFVQYWETKTISELREAGYDIDDDISDAGMADPGGDGTETARQEGRSVRDPDRDDADPASRELMTKVAFVRVDYDGDGIAELRRCVYVGIELLENEPTERICVACLTPTIMPHRHQGISVADSVMDLQEIQSTLMRGLLDNMYLANNGRYAINEDTVMLDDMLESRPGSIVRVQGNPNESIAPLVHPNLSANVLQTMEYISLQTENRTGASPRVMQGQAVDGNAINQTASGISQIMGAAMSRIELIARIFAETGVKDIFDIVHMLCLKHQSKEEMVELRGEWVDVDPREWKRRYHMKVQVGLGTGTRDEQIAKLQLIIAALPNLMAINVTTPHHIYNAMSKLIDLMGWKGTDEFVQDPMAEGAIPPPPQPPDPKVLVEQAKLAQQGQKNKADAYLKEMDIKAGVFKQQMDDRFRTKDSFLKSQIDIAKTLAGTDSQQEPDSDLLTDGADGQPSIVRQLMHELIEQRKPKRRIVRHHRDASGRIAESEVIE